MWEPEDFLQKKSWKQSKEEFDRRCQFLEVSRTNSEGVAMTSRQILEKLLKIHPESLQRSYRWTAW